ncbi:MAG: Rieske 2Fe-2S domain-containing protein [Rhodospirillales bacterium]|nr:Rieske 2Fe-2S domain-containing protein [Rhodospirillales bacterium]
MAQLDWHTNDFSEIPYTVYSDDDIYAQEQKQIFQGDTWNFLGLECEISEPGTYKTTFVGDVPVIVVRDEAGSINAMVNRCAHRGNLVCIDESGTVERLTCVYHNWTYDLQGNLATIAFERGIQGKGGMADDFDHACHGLACLRVETYCGLIFGTFSGNLESLADYLGPEMRANIDRVLGRKMEILGRFRHGLDGNWKLYMENVRDSYHATLLHSFQTTFRLNRLSMKGGVVLGDGGLHHLTYSIRATDQAESQYNAKDLHAVKDGYSLKAPELIEGWPEYECGTTLAIQSIFPNFSVQQVSNVITVRLNVPKGPHQSELTWWILAPVDDTPEERTMRLHQSNLIGPGGFIAMEDGAVMGWVRRGVAGAANQKSIIAMGGHDIEQSSGSRCTELAVRGFWRGWYGLMER